MILVRVAVPESQEGRASRDRHQPKGVSSSQSWRDLTHKISYIVSHYSLTYQIGICESFLT